MSSEDKEPASTKGHSRPIYRWLPWIGLAIHLIFLLLSWPLAEGLASATQYRMEHDFEYISGEGWESDVQHTTIILCTPLCIYAPTFLLTVFIKAYAIALERQVKWLPLLGTLLGIFTLINVFCLILVMIMDFISGKLSLLLRS